MNQARTYINKKPYRPKYLKAKAKAEAKKRGGAFFSPIHRQTHTEKCTSHKCVCRSL